MAASAATIVIGLAAGFGETRAADESRASGAVVIVSRATKACFPPGDRIGYDICLSLRDRGVFLRPLGDVIALMPPLSSTEAELTHLAASAGYRVAYLPENLTHFPGREAALLTPA